MNGAFASAFSTAYDLFVSTNTFDTTPYCGACGYNAAIHDLRGDLFCDSCGADTRRFGFTP